MALIQWDESLSVNVAEIDEQHKVLIDMINGLNESMRQGKSKDILGKTLNGLVNYAVIHFSTEEKYFDRFGYAKSYVHKKKHTDFTKKVAEFKTGFDSGQLMLSIDVMNFLSDWLQNHIKGTDKEYSSFFNEKGLK